MAEHNEIGKIGENIAKAFLMKHGFSVKELNYRTKYGELDIIAEKDKKIRFVEVKAIKVRGFTHLETLHVKPEDNLTQEKWNHLRISAETYLRHKNVPHVTPWQVDLACVYIDTDRKEGKVILMENIHKE
jgi:putative endonuclease